MLSFREQFIPAGVVFIFIQEPYLYHPVFKVCVCVRFTKNHSTLSVLVIDFQRTVYAHWQCVAFFREHFKFLVPFKGISFYTVGILTSAVYLTFLPHLTALCLQTD